jgi:hypothetical protein
VIHDIPARSRLVPAVPITSPQFVYRKARETDVGLTFARARTELETAPDRRARGGRADSEVGGAATG